MALQRRPQDRALRHYVDTAKHIAAWNGEDTTRRPALSALAASA